MKQQIKIKKQNKKLVGSIYLPSSKSISNRILMICFLSREDFTINNLSTAKDTVLLAKILESLSKKYSDKIPTVIDAGNAGTAFRFLTAALCITPGKWLLTGSKRMRQRPIKPLVDALIKLGANIKYTDKKNYPPLLISGNKLSGGEIEIDSSVSSQFVSAILMIAPLLSRGLKIILKNKTVSSPYINMTLNPMRSFGIEFQKNNNIIEIAEQKYQAKKQTIEADWSAASYWYEMAALSNEVDLKINGLTKNSLQGDSIISEIFKKFGVKTKFTSEGIHLSKEKSSSFEFNFDFADYPDIVQTLAVTCAGLDFTGTFSGIQSLKIKETNRIIALKKELKKIDCFFEEQSENKWKLSPKKIIDKKEKLETHSIKTYEDHRMAMAFAPLAICKGEIIIEDPDVVIKSYPGFWDDLKSIGFEIEEL